MQALASIDSTSKAVLIVEIHCKIGAEKRLLHKIILPSGIASADQVTYNNYARALGGQGRRRQFAVTNNHTLDTACVKASCHFGVYHR